MAKFSLTAWNAYLHFFIKSTSTFLIARALTVCEEQDRETILRIIREMTALLRRN